MAQLAPLLTPDPRTVNVIKKGFILLQILLTQPFIKSYRKIGLKSKILIFTALPVETQVLMTLKLLAGRQYQQVTGDCAGAAQSTVSKVLHRVILAVGCILASIFLLFK